MTDEEKFRAALLAIRALIEGEYDRPELVAVGPLSVNKEDDVLAIIERALEL